VNRLRVFLLAPAILVMGSTFSPIELRAQTPGADTPVTASATPAPPPGVVRAVLFHSPGCPQCTELVHTDLPRIQAQLGAALDLVVLSTDDDYGDIAYEMAEELYLEPGQESGVPMLVIGDRIITGPGPIRDLLPVLVQTYLAEGGLDWPSIPGLAEFLAATRPTSAAPTQVPATTEPAPTYTATPAPTTTPTASPAPTPTPLPPPGPIERLAGAPIALLLVLLGVGLAAAKVALAWRRRSA